MSRLKSGLPQPPKKSGSTASTGTSIQSRKAKGRRLAQWVQTKIYERFPRLRPGDCTVTPSGVNGPDVQLSPTAKDVFRYAVEAKSWESLKSVYKIYDQAITHVLDDEEPLVVIKSNFKKPLVILDAEHFFSLLGDK